MEQQAAVVVHSTRPCQSYHGGGRAGTFRVGGSPSADCKVFSRRSSRTPTRWSKKTPRMTKFGAGPGFGWRHIQLLIMFASASTAITMRVCLSVAIVVMTGPDEGDGFP
ncbi:hypothetical protein FOCC_FOCC011545, partial [Frankliniella occidentalis]